MISRAPARARLVGVFATVILCATGCGGPPAPATDVVSDTDRDRAAVLAADPVLAGALSPPIVLPGRVRSEKLGWDRTEVRARIYQHQAATTGAGPEPSAVEAKMAETFATLRSGGWTVHWAMCLPPPVIPEFGQTPPPPVRIPVGIPRADGWQWFALGFRITGGVSYWTMLSAELGDTGDAWVDIVLRAPNARDAANLFSDAPKALDPGKTCAEDGQNARDVEQAGAPTVLRAWWPYPAHSRSPDPQRL